MPETNRRRGFRKQAFSSGTSVGATYPEADRGVSRAEFIAKCGDYLHEADETVDRLEL